MQNDAIGVFDSGIGGLTVVKNIKQMLPNENIIYFGDIARIPYGTKSVSMIKKFTQQTVKFLLNHNVKAIVIACNTISAIAKQEVLNLSGSIPVIDVISAGVEASLPYKQIGVIATPATINSNAYSHLIRKANTDALVQSQACGLFVNMIEEGFANHPAMDLVAKEYLDNLISYNLDSIILGCTHYPLIKHSVRKILGDKIKIIDPSTMAVKKLKLALEENNNLNQDSTNNITTKFYVTDIPLKFQSIGEKFLGEKMNNLEIVNIDN